MKLSRLLFAAMLAGAPAIPAQVQQPAARNQTIAKYTGEVRKFTPGSELEVDVGGKRVKNFDLSAKDTTFEVDPDIAPGRKVSIVESKDASGNKTVNVRLGRH